MKKVGIVTITDYNNYGNRLQNYATQQVIEKMGYSAESIKNTYGNNKSIKALIKKTMEKGFKESFYAIKRRSQEKKTRLIYEEREEKFKNFTKEYIKETDYFITPDSIPDNLGSKYDYFVTGSDQVWNPIYRNESPVDFLQFAPAEKRIAFSPSFGVSEIPERTKKKYSKWLTEIKALSVREEAGAKIIKDLTGRNAETLVDPTLLLNNEEWLSIAKVSTVKPKKQYFLTYFLGEISKKDKLEIEKFGVDNNLVMLNLNNIKDKDSFLVDPAEFIDLINSAAAVFTDSFHGAVFSIILNTPFIVFDRIENGEVKMSSRIDTLLNKFNLFKNHYRNNDSLNNVLLQDKNYQSVIKILNLEKEKSLKYLEKSFK